MLDLHDHPELVPQFTLPPDSEHATPQEIGLVGVLRCSESLAEDISLPPVLVGPLLALDRSSLLYLAGRRSQLRFFVLVPD